MTYSFIHSFIYSLKTFIHKVLIFVEHILANTWLCFKCNVNTSNVDVKTKRKFIIFVMVQNIGIRNGKTPRQADCDRIYNRIGLHSLFDIFFLSLSLSLPLSLSVSQSHSAKKPAKCCAALRAN